MIKELLMQLEDKYRHRISVYQHLVSHLDPMGRGLVPGGEFLPDEEEYQLGEGLHWIAGAYDSVVGHPMIIPREELMKRVEEFVSAVKKFNDNPCPDTVAEMENVMAQPDTLSIIDGVLRRLITTAGINQTLLYQICRFLFFHSHKRGVVKFCTSIMGLYGLYQDLPYFLEIGKHEEFTLYASVAVSNTLPSPDETLLNMAKTVKGWGRIHIVNRLMDSESPRIKDFLLREGFRNIINMEYTAVPIARRVGLKEILEQEELEPEIYRGIGQIIHSSLSVLGEKGPFIGWEKYRDSFVVLMGFLSHSKKMAKTSSDYLIIDKIKEKLSPFNPKGEPNKVRESLLWDESLFREALSLCDEILSPPRWREMVVKELPRGRGEKANNFYPAIIVAQKAGIETKELNNYILSCLEHNFYDRTLWYYVGVVMNEELLEGIIGLYLKKLPSPEEKKGGEKTPITALFSSAMEWYWREGDSRIKDNRDNEEDENYSEKNDISDGKSQHQPEKIVIPRSFPPEDDSLMPLDNLIRFLMNYPHSRMGEKILRITLQDPSSKIRKKGIKLFIKGRE